MTDGGGRGSQSIPKSERSDYFPDWARWMTWIALLITASPAWLSGLEMLMRSYGIPPAATASSALTGSTIRGYTTGEIWLSTFVAELFILVVWRNRNRQYTIWREQSVTQRS